jgi:uncharacterized SAM-binding protein YcdF (DUF218 family)
MEAQMGKNCRVALAAALLLSCLVAVSAEQLKPADVIIGLGFGPARDKDGKPNAELRRRTEKVVELYKQGLAPNIIFTGSDTGAGCEAEVMKEVAVKLGVPPEKIFTETKAVDTITNSRYSVAIMKQHGWKSAILVSNKYHVKRGEWLFKSNPGIEIQTAAAETPADAAYQSTVLIHEGAAWLGYLAPDTREKATAKPGD